MSMSDEPDLTTGEAIVFFLMLIVDIAVCIILFPFILIAHLRERR